MCKKTLFLVQQPELLLHCSPAAGYCGSRGGLGCTGRVLAWFGTGARARAWAGSTAGALAGRGAGAGPGTAPAATASPAAAVVFFLLLLLDQAYGLAALGLAAP